ncbi:MAG: hypothetical protein PF549_00565 [Patescibacteria group bacterium]|jgi:hypothetical protein|nr:hypothetical protein [Patescibacteria group bacterium]
MEELLKFKSLEEELRDIRKLKGKERALDLKYVTEYVKKNEGKGKYNFLIKKLKKLGFELPTIDSLKKMDWIPLYIPVSFTIASAKIFNWKRQDMIDMGRGFITFSPLLKIFIKYFVSPEKTLLSGVESWRKHYTTGKLELTKYDNDKKEIIFRIKDFKTHPIDYIFIIGSFEKLGEIALGLNNVRGQGFQKKDYYELIFRWE